MTLNEKILDILREDRRRAGLHFRTIWAKMKNNNKAARSLPKNWERRLLKQLRLMEQQGELISLGTGHLFFKVSSGRRRTTDIPSPPASITESPQQVSIVVPPSESPLKLDKSSKDLITKEIDGVRQELERVAEEGGKLQKEVNSLETINVQKRNELQKAQRSCRKLSNLARGQVNVKVCLLQQEQRVNQSNVMASVIRRNLKMECGQWLRQKLTEIDNYYEREKQQLLLDDENGKLNDLSYEQEVEREDLRLQLRLVEEELHQVKAVIEMKRENWEKVGRILKEMSSL